MPNERLEQRVGGPGVGSSSEGPGQHYPLRSKSSQTAPAVASGGRERRAETPPAPPGLRDAGQEGFQSLSPARRPHPPATTTQPETPGIPSRGGFLLPEKLMVVAPPSHLPAAASTHSLALLRPELPSYLPPLGRAVGKRCGSLRNKTPGEVSTFLHNSQTFEAAKKQRVWITRTTLSQHVVIRNIPTGPRGAMELQVAPPPPQSLGTASAALRPHVCSQRCPVGGIQGV